MDSSDHVTIKSGATGTISTVTSPDVGVNDRFPSCKRHQHQTQMPTYWTNVKILPTGHSGSKLISFNTASRKQHKYPGNVYNWQRQVHTVTVKIAAQFPLCFC